MSSSSNKLSWFLKCSLAAGLLFLYIPLFILVIYSFNDSKLVVWHFDGQRCDFECRMVVD